MSDSDDGEAQERMTAGPAAAGTDRLAEMLDELLHHPEWWEQIVARVERAFTQTKAVMVLDMSGFSRTTLDRGIVPFLLMIHQMQLLTIPSVERNGGKLVKSEADNLFCIFDSVHDAVEAASEIAIRLQTANVVLPKDRQLYASIGIGYGPILNVGDQDLWGPEMNIASKLGEDVAVLGEILLSEAARSSLGESPRQFGKRTLSVSGLELSYHAIEPEATGRVS